jgi:hypothetical protein
VGNNHASPGTSPTPPGDLRADDGRAQAMSRSLRLRKYAVLEP